MPHKYIHYEKKIWIFRFSFYKLRHKWTVRFELSSGWDD